MNWLRLWHDMPTDPKWRTIARLSQRSISDVMAVYIHLLVSASNADERGRTQANAEDIASALDMHENDVAAVLDAMQGRVMEGDRLTGWEKRQPKREDNAADRAREWRERKRTQTNACERPDKRREDTEKNREEESFSHPQADATDSNPESQKFPQKPAVRSMGTRLAEDRLPALWEAHAVNAERMTSEEARREWDRFHDYWVAQPGVKGRKVDWFATWRNWLRNSKSRDSPPQLPVAFPDRNQKRRDDTLAFAKFLRGTHGPAPGM